MSRKKSLSEREYPILQPWVPLINSEPTPDDADPRFEQVVGGKRTKVPSLDDIESGHEPGEENDG